MRRFLLLAFLLFASPAFAQNTFPASNPGDMIYKGNVGAWALIPGGTAGCALISNGPTVAATWQCSLATGFQLPPMATNTFWGNVTGVQAVPQQVTVTQILDTIDYDIQHPPPNGSTIQKGADGIWHVLSGPAQAGWVFTSGGTGQPPVWTPAAGSIVVPGVAGTCLVSNGPSVAPSYQACIDATALKIANNLSDLASAATARSNLGLTYFATGTDAANLTGTVASARIAGAYTGLTGTGTLTAGATGAGFTVALGTSTLTGTLPSANFSGSYTGLTGTGTLTSGATGAGFTVALGTSTITGNLPIANSPSIATNTVLGNATAGTAAPTALAVASCSGATSALTWTTNTGFGCHTISAGSSGVFLASDYGVVCDGATDNTAFFAAAIAAMPAKGGILLLPVGTGTCKASAINVSKNIILMGQGFGETTGSGSTELQGTSGTLDFITLSADFASISNVIVTHSVARTAGCSIKTTALLNRVDRVGIRAPFRGFCGASFAPQTRDVVVSASVDAGFYYSGNYSGFVIEDTQSNEAGVHAYYFTGTSVGGIISNAGANAPVTGNNFKFDGSNADIWIGGQSGGSNAPSDGISFENNTGENINLANIFVEAAGRFGVWIGPNTAKVMINGGSINGSATAGITIDGDEVTISGTMLNANAIGINLAATSSGVVLSGVLGINGTDGINIVAGAGAFTCSSVFFKGTTNPQVGTSPAGTQAAACPGITTGTASFTGTFTGCTTAPTQTIFYSVSGRAVTVFLVQQSATSNATSFTITGIPAAIRPARNQVLPIVVTDNGAAFAGIVSVEPAGNFTFFTSIAAAIFTNSGTKGIMHNQTLTYLLD